MVAYGSNNKYSLLGAFRNFARMVGYEVPLGITVVSVAVMTGSLNIVEISECSGYALEYFPAAPRMSSYSLYHLWLIWEGFPLTRTSPKKN